LLVLKPALTPRAIKTAMFFILTVRVGFTANKDGHFFVPSEFLNEHTKSRLGANGGPVLCDACHQKKGPAMGVEHRAVVLNRRALPSRESRPWRSQSKER
jgi:hypothetical protein